MKLTWRAAIGMHVWLDFWNTFTWIHAFAQPPKQQQQQQQGKMFKLFKIKTFNSKQQCLNKKKLRVDDLDAAQKQRLD